MIRTQIQLAETQYEALRNMAHRWHVSLAELIRRGIDKLLAEDATGPQAQREKMIALAGRYQTAERDVSEHHDRYFANLPRPPK
ncbi:MAG: CopG family transcriptional regulator [Deltaproteobacteria bacterium]|nr:CopG family transcriptional regulator [Deltaproteobacteria bacterium]